MLDTETMRTFTKVVECNSFSKAAKLLYKTPAAISYRIKSLEAELNTQLFERTTRTVSLTLAGQHLYEHCSQWLLWLNSMPEELQQIRDGVERRVNLTINNLLYDSDAITELLDYLLEKYPFTHFTINRQVYMGVWDSLLYGECHLAIGATGTESLDNMINIFPLGEITWAFVAAKHHPITRIDTPLSNDALRKYPAINVEDTSIHMNKRVAWLLPSQTEIIVPDISTKLACHLKGLGIGFLPRSLCQPYLDTGELIECKVINERKPSPLSLAWKKSNMGKVMNEIVNLFKYHHPIALRFLKNIDKKR
ncbi:HTH-type transcriptional activator AllS [Gilliamella sp. CG16]|uniref:HTH-type transcriptional activator AllS n=1 Tax=Gilliamella sp. CG16 TaxID=3351503 RepID=UPI003987364D